MVDVTVAVGLRWSPGFEDRTCRRQVNAERLGVAPVFVRQAMGPQRLNIAVDGNADCGVEVFQSRILDHLLARGQDELDLRRVYDVYLRQPLPVAFDDHRETADRKSTRLNSSHYCASRM